MIRPPGRRLVTITSSMRYVEGKRITQAALFALAALLSHTSAAECDPKPGLTHFYSDGWGIELNNQRLQHDTTINRANVSRLKLAWVYGFANKKPRSWPLITEDTIFIGDSGRGVVALDRATGCTRWVHGQKGEISSAILHAKIGERAVLLYLHRTEGLYAIDAATGTEIWHTHAAEAVTPFYSGTPVVHDGAAYVPLSSFEVGLAMNPLYGCCTTRGGMAAFDVQSGKELWYRPTIDEPAKQTGRRWLFIGQYAPSGAPVWGAPLLDAERGLVFFGTGENYSRPATDTSDAIFAVDATTGERRWVHQFTEGDAYNIACDMPGMPNCPQPRGPDLDFGAPPVLAHDANGRALLIVGQKSGDIYALNPDDGAILWHRDIGRGGALGGAHWGLAANEQKGMLFVPISDIETWTDKTVPPATGLHALDIATGSTRWEHPRDNRCPDRDCFGGLSSAITATPELVVAGSLDGFLEIYDADTGATLWSDDSWKPFETVDGRKASGGAYDAHGPMVAGNQVIVSSGYDSFGQKPGNALLVYQLEGETAP